LQQLWSEHCLADTEGAKLRSDLTISQTDIILKKGIKQDVDAYSPFYDSNDQTATPIAKALDKASFLPFVFFSLRWLSNILPLFSCFHTPSLVCMS
jgi:nicotinamidase/pyrazinamidase